jgi:hypothetical protein
MDARLRWSALPTESTTLLRLRSLGRSNRNAGSLRSVAVLAVRKGRGPRSESARPGGASQVAELPLMSVSSPKFNPCWRLLKGWG